MCPGTPSGGERVADGVPGHTLHPAFAALCLVAPLRSSDIRPGINCRMQVKVFNEDGDLVGPIEAEKVEKSDAEWREQLSPTQFQIARGKGTERAFCGTLLDNKKHGVYACVCCDLPLFASDAKFESGTGWPSFFKPVHEGNVTVEEDRTHGMIRTEILCARCDCHLGHVFPDGPPPTGHRHCVNSESLRFVDQSELSSLADPLAASSSSGTSATPR